MLKREVGGDGALSDVEQEREGEGDTSGAGNEKRAGEAGEIGMCATVGARDEGEILRQLDLSRLGLVWTGLLDGPEGFLSGNCGPVEAACKTFVGLENENEVTVVGGWCGGDGCWMRLQNTEARD